MDIQGKVAVVTGASRGLGSRVALRLAGKGARLALLGRNPGRLEAMAQECRAVGAEVLATAGEIGEAGYVTQAFDRIESEFGLPDILVNCAGISLPGKLGFDQIPPAMFEEMMRTNVTGTYLTCFRVFAPMKQRGSGVIVNIGSTAAHVALAGSSIYAASKHAVRAFTDSMIAESDGSGVRVCMVSSGPINTPIWDSRPAPAGVPREAMLQPDDIADTILWLIERRDGIRIDEVLMRPSRLEAMAL
jgi:NADP-dependent 3-hydroxy acid dehydrogenase YdfG